MIRATKVQIEDLKESLIWQDIMDEMKILSDNASQEPDAIVATAADENPTSATVCMRIGHASGIKVAVAHLERLLDNMLLDKEQEKNDSERK